MENINKMHFEDFIIDSTFKDFVTGSNKESVEKWQRWIEENPSASQEFEKAIQVMKLLLKTRKNIKDVNTKKVLNELLEKIRNQKEKTVSHNLVHLQWFRRAGVVALIVSLSLSIYFIAKRSPASKEKVDYNEIIVALGDKAKVILADGTYIWINSSSKLRYPVNFSKNLRNIYLEGEAYFDVAKNEKAPFIVNTPDLRIKVLGTAFNVKNYPGEMKAITTVVRGLVSVEDEKKSTKAVMLRPNENYILYTVPTDTKIENKSDNRKKEAFLPAKIQSIVNKDVNIEAITSWKDQMLVFFDEPLEEVALKMERWYNVKIHIMNDKLKKERYRGKFANNESIFQVLAAIEYTTPIKYRNINNEFFIDKSK